MVNIITADATRPFAGRLRRPKAARYGTAYRQRRRRRQGRAVTTGGWAAIPSTTKGISAFDEAFGGTAALRLPHRRPVAAGSATTSRRTSSSTSAPTTAGAAATSTASTPRRGAFGDDGEYGHTQQWIDYTGLNFVAVRRPAEEPAGLRVQRHRPQQPGSRPAWHDDQTFMAHGRTDTVEYEGTSRHRARLSGGVRRPDASARPWSSGRPPTSSTPDRGQRHHQQRLRPDHRRGAVGPDPDRRRALRRPDQGRRPRHRPGLGRLVAERRRTPSCGPASARASRPRRSTSSTASTGTRR